MTKKVIQDKPISSYHHSIDNICWEQTMYQLSPAPKKLPYDTRIRLCLERKNFYHFRWFLHDYEKSLNGMAFSCCMRYDMPHYFGDVKATIVMAHTEALHRYKPDTGVPFLAFAKYYVRDAVRDFIRLNSGMFSIASRTHYRQLAKANALYYASLDEGKSTQESLANIAEQMQITLQTADGLIAEGEAFRQHKNERPTFLRSLDDERSYPTQCYERGDRSHDPERIVMNTAVWQVLISGLETLRYKDTYVLLRSCGIFCMYCVATKPKERNGELANEFEHSNPATIQRAKKNAIDELQDVLPWWMQYVRWGE